MIEHGPHFQPSRASMPSKKDDEEEVGKLMDMIQDRAEQSHQMRVKHAEELNRIATRSTIMVILVGLFGFVVAFWLCCLAIWLLA